MRTSLLLAVVAGLCLAACGGTGTTPATPTAAASAATPPVATAPSGWVDADLSTTPAKLPLVVRAPAGYTLAKSPMDGAELTSEAVTFDVDDVTESGPTALASKKADVKTNSGMTFEKFVLEQPDGFIAEMGASNFIPVRLVKVGGKTYQFSVIPLNALPSEEAARQLYDAASQAKAK
jgi:hypothetical protein